MSDLFNLASVDSDIFLAIGKLSALHFLCGEYIRDLNGQTGGEIVKTIEDIEMNLDKVKKDIVKMLFILEKNEKEQE